MDNNSLTNLETTTPMMQQYLSVKKDNPDSLLFFRMGDFFELFFEDAKTAAAELNIALTSRNKHQGDDVPMCGVPVSAMEHYLAKLIKGGYKVAICDQVETPEEAKKRGGYKAVVKREVTQIATPGTILDENLLNAKENNFLMSIYPIYLNRESQKQIFSSKDKGLSDLAEQISNSPLKNKKDTPIAISYAVTDISTDIFQINTVVIDEFLNHLEKFSPKEVLMPLPLEQSEWFLKEKINFSKTHITALSASKFSPLTERQRVMEYFGVSSLEGFGLSLDSEISVCGSIIEYISITQCSNIPKLSPPKKTSKSKYMIIDAATQKNLDISTARDNSTSLLNCMDETLTAFGARLLASRILSPIVDIGTINSRLDTVEFFVKNRDLLLSLRKMMQSCPDVERALIRLKFKRFSARDISVIRYAIDLLQKVTSELNNYDTISLEGEISHVDLFDFSDILDLLNRSLIDEMPLSYKEGNVIKPGYSSELDELRSIASGSKQLIHDLQAEYIKAFSINTLKIKNNNILGWYIELPLSQKNKVGYELIHRQTLVNCARYTSEKLQHIEMKLHEANDNLLNTELKIFIDVVQILLDKSDEISLAIRFLSLLDLSISMAYIAHERNYIRPQLINNTILEIKEGRHPVLELVISDFVNNDCHLSESSRISLLTGPNMAGKSTYLRQNALIILMAHIGSFVPAKEAKIGITDKLFSRIGASDDLAKGHSTFMVEMIETAAILNQATENSFVILDEVGRGTSTYDGMSIAWAVVDYLYKKNKSRVIFATHYMELTSIKNELLNLQCQTLKIQEWKDKVIFHHKIIDGVADKSYGIYVAKLAGLPAEVIHKADKLLHQFKSYSPTGVLGDNNQLSLLLKE